VQGETSYVNWNMKTLKCQSFLLLIIAFTIKPNNSFHNTNGLLLQVGSVRRWPSSSTIPHPVNDDSFWKTNKGGGDQFLSAVSGTPATPLFLATSSPTRIDNDNDDVQSSLTEPKKNKKRKKSLFAVAWVHVMSIFIILNYRSAAVCSKPAILGQIPFAALSFIHAISGMLSSGSIVTTTLLEWLVVKHENNDKNQSVYKFWFTNVPKVEQMIVIPALSGSMISGIGQAFSKYGSLKLAPKHVKSSLHVLFLFGLWWGLTDRTTQIKAQEYADSSTNFQGMDEVTTKLPPVFRQRRISNLVSCIFLVVLYGMMVLKPGYTIVI
jgi:hypothetical protein